jgi:branched-chain amino acid transport system substrate-binding protein
MSMTIFSASPRLPILLLASLALISVGCGNRANPEPIPIGHVAPFSGADKEIGEHARRAIQLVVKDVNDGDKLLHRKILVDHADTRSDKSSVRGATMRLVTVGRVVALVGGNELANVESLDTLAQSRPEQMGACPVLLTASSPQRPAGGSLFYLGLPQAQQGQTLARFAADDLKGIRVAILHHADWAGAADAFAREYPPNNIVGRWSYPSADKLKPVAEEVQKKEAEAVLFAGPTADLVALPGNALGTKSAVLLAGDDIGPGKWRPAGPLYAVTAWALDEKIAPATEFANRFRTEYKEEPDAQAALTYDAMRMLVEAILKAETVDGTKIRAALAELSFDGVTGSIKFGPERRVVRAAFVVEWKEKPILRKRYEAE